MNAFATGIPGYVAWAARTFSLWLRGTACFLAGITHAYTLAPENLATDYTLQTFTVEQGLPQNSVTKIAQTPDGYLWFATYRGLVRFDGVRFMVFDSGNTPAIVGDDTVEALHRDRRGRLSVVMKGGDLVWIDHGRITRGNGTRGLPDSPVGLRGESPDGWLHIGLQNTVQWYTETPTGSFVPKPWDPGLKVRDLAAVSADTDGSVWYREGASWTKVYEQSLLPLLPTNSTTNTAVQVVTRSGWGGTWIVSDQGVHLWEDNRWKRSIPSPEIFRACTAALEDQAGNLWIATWTQGLWRLDPEDHFHRYPISRGSEPEAIRSLFEDAEGNLWIGTEANGLSRLSRRVFQTMSAADGLAGEVVRSVSETPTGAMWVVTQAGVESFVPGQRPEPKVQFATDFPWCVFHDSTGRGWVGSYGGGIFFKDGDRTVTFEPNSPEDRRTITLFFEEPGKGLWVGRENGLWRVSGPQLVREPLPAAVSGFAVRSMTLDRQSRLWLGLSGGGLLSRESGGWDRVPIPDTPPTLSISTLLADSENTLWVGTAGRGYYRFRKGNFTKLDAESLGLPRWPSSILEDQYGYLWIGSSDGIFRVSRADLNAWADGRTRDFVPRRYGWADGLETSECSAHIQPAACRARDGRLWFATYRGVSVVDPGSLSPEPPPPPVLIEESVLWGRQKTTFSLTGHPESPRGSPAAPFTIPADTHLLEIHYTAPRFKAANRVRFRYRMTGLNSDWIEAGSRRVAYYQGLAPGTYRFDVTACNQDGVWNPQAAQLTVVMRPHFWQTWPFRAGLVVVLVGAMVAAYRARIQSFTRARTAQEGFARRLIASQEGERQRIARELHDSLGQNLLVIKSRVALAQRQAASPVKFTEHLQEAAEMTSQAIREVRDISQNLRPFQLDELGLTKAIAANIRKLAAVSPIHFETDLADLRGAFPPEQDIHFYRIVQECLNNVVKHSQATHCHVTVTRNEHTVRMVAADNGCGFAATDRLAGNSSREGNGLSNLQERTRMLGGQVELTSRPGAGTQISITVPLAT